MTALRLWMVAFALLFSQWVFANHDHEADHAVDEACQVCLVADHFDLPPATDIALQTLPAIEPVFTGLHSCFITPLYSSHTARAPPLFLYL
ncbi:MAG: hypothetical protein OQL16_12700 [Gammaproteobacteria bacterium]|nr:hypothetical protein [Gammaproteobacteria bacterium]